MTPVAEDVFVLLEFENVVFNGAVIQSFAEADVLAAFVTAEELAVVAVLAVVAEVVLSIVLLELVSVLAVVAVVVLSIVLLELVLVLLSTVL